jgi:hypothetical protein
MAAGVTACILETWKKPFSLTENIMGQRESLSGPEEYPTTASPPCSSPLTLPGSNGGLAHPATAAEPMNTI